MKENGLYDIEGAASPTKPSSTTRTWVGAFGPKGGTVIPQTLNLN
ncbi:hypothetical protein LEP1GSC058_2362 [Leptospira fainei serovar Hurstbridge str. BUT 6]|uniref:Uncharacterized protein n=1 Tax=Leptospira fainei serovar Hurstbridge str. BUT 6 TaxID=1193011 RepID=S3UXP2_9LEPT|nr:hypothetical protein [Leptospira fainei]EPG74003.1 hypothetical protein LEP1GSC058_2362 [Leptospira fainei serovar Hurstbridge str. BUT 6]